MGRVGIRQVRFDQVGLGQIWSGQVGLGQIWSGQVGRGQIWSGQISREGANKMLVREKAQGKSGQGCDQIK